MRELSQKELPIVSGGATGLDVSFKVNVPLTELADLQDLLIKLFTGVLNIETFSQEIFSETSSFDDMTFAAISIVSA